MEGERPATAGRLDVLLDEWGEQSPEVPVRQARPETAARA